MYYHKVVKQSICATLYTLLLGLIDLILKQTIHSVENRGMNSFPKQRNCNIFYLSIHVNYFFLLSIFTTYEQTHPCALWSVLVHHVLF